MRNAEVETERAPESTEQPNVSESADPPETAGSDNPQSLDALKRLSEFYPKEVAKILDGPDADKWSSEIYSKLCTKMDALGWPGVAGVAEFIDRWKPGNSEKHEAIAKITGALPNLSTECLQELADTYVDADGTPAATLDTKPQHDLNSAIDGAERKRPGIMGDLVQFIEDWTPAVLPDLSDLRERVRRISGLVEAAHLCEGSFTHGSGDKNAIKDYFTAISGSISVAASECRRLLADLDGNGGAHEH